MDIPAARRTLVPLVAADSLRTDNLAGHGVVGDVKPIYEEPPSRLLVLPNELIDHIFAFLDGEPLSTREFLQLPRLDWTESSNHPLKTISQVSHRLRFIILPRLYKHSRLNPAHLTPFLDFVRVRELTSKIESITALLPGPCCHIHPAWWARLLNSVPFRRFAVGCEPHVLSEIAGIPMNMNDSWAFNIPYQYLELRQTQKAATSKLSYSSLSSLIGAKPWYSLRINEGSSLSAYTQYEYFLKKTPSLLSNIQTYLSCMPSDATPDVLQRMFTTSALSIIAMQDMFEGLREFSFVAIFPFYNHVDDILKCIRRMLNLRTLFIKLCPEPDSTVLDDEVKAAKGHIDLNDPWAEITTAYNLVAYTIQFLGIEGQLSTFTIDDVKVEGIRETITSHVTNMLPLTWKHDGNGTWRKATSLTADAENTS